jgi:hypothetical protein
MLATGVRAGAWDGGAHAESVRAIVSQVKESGVRASNRAPAGSLAVRLLSGWALFSLVDQHDRDAISNRITPATRITDKAFVLEPDGRFAGGACEDVEQLLVDHPGETPGW